MADIGCCKVMAAMELIFSEEKLAEVGEELLARFRAGEKFSAIIADVGDRYNCFAGKTKSKEARRIIDHWPAFDLELVRGAIVWGLTNRDKGTPVHFHWKGDDEFPETVTRFEVNGNDISVEFLHPPAFAAQRVA